MAIIIRHTGNAKGYPMEVNLILFKKDGTAKSFALPSAVSVLGRRQECDLCIPLSVVSRKHCELNMDQGQLKIRDLGSKNGTIVNGHRTEEARLNPGDKIKIGPVTFLVQINGQPSDLSLFMPALPAAASGRETPAAPPTKVKSFKELVGDLSDVDLEKFQQTQIFENPTQDMGVPGQNG